MKPSIALTLGVIISAMQTDSLYPPDSLVVASHSEWTHQHYKDKIAEFKKDPLKEGEIVFIGDSITEQGEDWSAKLGVKGVRNRGISGDTSDGVLPRLGELIHYKPQAVFILIGTNDVFREKLTGIHIGANVIKIAAQIHDGSPKTKVYVQTIMPNNFVETAAKIKDANAVILAGKGKGSYEVVDLYPLFVNEKSGFKKGLSPDGLHLNEEGYKIWVNAVSGFVKDK